MNRMLGGGARTLIRSSWHMFPGRAAAGMSALDTVDSLLMTMTVLVAGFVGTGYLCGLLVDHVEQAAELSSWYAGIGDHFEVLGYVIVALFVAAWLVAAVTWRFGGFDRRYGRPRR